jgi:hypothetical protein
MRSRQHSLYRVIRPLRLVAICVALISLVVLGQAQSGRRPQKPATSLPRTDAASSEIAEESPKAPTKENSVRKVRVLIATQPTAKSLPSEDSIHDSFINRLNEFPALEAFSLGNLDRKKAVKRAKAETDAFVVLMRFEIDSFQHGVVVFDSPDLKVTYYVFAPRTGKLKTKDKVYYQAIGAKARKDNWPNGPPLRITPAAAGIIAAERLHDWLMLATLRQANR